MKRKEYISHLTESGYRVISEEQVALGPQVFHIHQGTITTALGPQDSFWLTIADSATTPDPDNTENRKGDQ